MAKTLLDTRKTGQRVRTFIFLCVDAHTQTHADERRRMQNFSAAFFVQSAICLGLEPLSPPILVPC